MASRGKAGGPDTTDSIDIAMGRARDSDQARELLSSQSHLIFTQELLARADLRHRGWQIIGERVGAILKIMTATVGALVLIGITAFLWSAHRASGMVMDPFNVPPALDRQGLSGAVVSQQLLDKIATLESSTQSFRASSSYENSWSDSKGVTVPYAGVSLGELRREMRDWLGAEKHLSGDVVQLSGGKIAISFRTIGASGRVEGAEGDYNNLLQQVALQVFKATQPYRYSVYEGRAGNGVESRAVLLELARGENPRERLWALHGLALLEGAQAQTAAVYRRLLAIDPNFVPAVGNIWLADQDARHDEAAFAGVKRAIAAYRQGADDLNREFSNGFAIDNEARLEGDYLGDLGKAATLSRKAEDYRAGPVNAAARPFSTAQYSAWAHDFSGALEALRGAALSPLAQRPDYAKIIGPQLDLQGYLAIATGNEAGIAVAYQRLIDRLRADAGKDGTVNERSSNDDSIRALLPVQALALARNGRLAQAQATVASLPNDNDGAFQVRVFVAALSRDPSADRLFAAAAARTPSLPAASLLWAEALVRTGRYAEAETQAREALRRGPNSAEAQRWLGEALLAQRKNADAEHALAAAARLEPAWGGLRMRWAEALWRLGKRDTARTQLAEAARRALNPADRAQLVSMMKKAKA